MLRPRVTLPTRGEYRASPQVTSTDFSTCESRRSSTPRNPLEDEHATARTLRSALARDSRGWPPPMPTTPLMKQLFKALPD